MLQPTRSKYRKAHKGRIHGYASRCNYMNYGGYGLIGIKTESTRDTLTIYGNPKIKFQKKISVSTNLDHRIAMSFFILGQTLGTHMTIKVFESVNSSFPNFLKLQKKLGAKYEIKK